MYLLIFISFMSSCQMISNTDKISTEVNILKDSNKRTETKHILHFLETINGFWKSVPIQLEETEYGLCNVHLQFFLQSLQNAEPWAFQMYDSSTKLTDGILTGNLNQLGNFDECINVKVPDGPFVGKHCIATFTEKNTSLSSNHNKLRPRNFRWSYCIPSSCSSADWEHHLSELMEHSNLSFKASVSDLDCHIMESKPLSTRDWVAVAFFIVFGLFVFLSTTYELMNKNKESRRELLLAFSLLYNGRKLLSSSSTGDTLHALHGIRFLSTVWIVCFHVYYAYVLYYPLTNTAYLEEMLLSGSNSAEHYMLPFLYNGSLAVDTFLVLSGLLVSYTFFKGMKDKKNLSSFNVPKYYLHRYLRLTPAYCVIILLQATLFVNIDSGPLWDSNMQDITRPCQDYWWLALLYLQNYIHPTDICLGHSWYLSVDMQLYIISPIALILLWKKPKLGTYLLGFLVVVGVVINFVISYIYEFTEAFLTLEGMKLNYTDVLYSPTHTRYPPWLLGIILGFHILQSRGKNLIIPKSIVALGWICAGVLGVGSVWLIYPIMQLDYTYNVLECSFYSMLYHIVWSMAVSWLIFACLSGYGGPVNTILSWSGWQPFSKLSYSIYLIHYPVIFMRCFSRKTPVYVSATNMFSDMISNLGISTMFAVILYLVFELPALTIEKHIFKGT